MLRPTLDYRRSPDRITSAQNRHVRWRLLIFVAIAWTNLAGLVPTLFAEEALTPIASINLSLTIGWAGPWSFPVPSLAATTATRTVG
jgi:hypothetical protein